MKSSAGDSTDSDFWTRLAAATAELYCQPRCSARDLITDFHINWIQKVLIPFKEKYTVIPKTMDRTENQFPRRARLDLMSPAEKAIYNATQAVEAMPPDVRLTNAVVKLSEAQHLVADFVDEDLSKREYYLRSKGFVGNALCWWLPGGAGYTTDIRKAGKFTEEEAKARTRYGGTAAYLCSDIDGNEPAHKLIIDSQFVTPGRVKWADEANQAI